MPMDLACPNLDGMKTSCMLCLASDEGTDSCRDEVVLVNCFLELFAVVELGVWSPLTFLEDDLVPSLRETLLFLEDLNI
jgi:hypothetical protein